AVRARRENMEEKTIVPAIEERTWIDRAADPVQRAAIRVLERAPRVHDALHGTWLGHPLHAALTDVAIGSWSSGVCMDLADRLGRRRALRAGADAAHALGLTAAGAAALAGVTDWTHTSGNARRVGFLHGTLNLVIAGLFGASLIVRRRGDRNTGVALSALG